MVVREPFDWSALVGGELPWAIAVPVVAALAFAVRRLTPDRSREGRD